MQMCACLCDLLTEVMAVCCCRVVWFVKCLLVVTVRRRVLLAMDRR